MLGKGYLCAVVTQDATNWPTPCAMEAEKAGLFNKGQMGQSLSAMANRGELGQAAPANPSTDGSRQESWPTPTALNRVRDEETMQKCLKFRQGNGQTSVPLYLEEKVNLEEKSWRTPSSSDMESNGPNGHQGTYLAGAVKQWATPMAWDHWMTNNPRTDGGQQQLPNQVKQWMTPRACEAQNPPMGVDKRHHGLTHQVRANEWRTPTVAEEKNQNPSKQIYLQNQVGATVKQWATPRPPNGGQTTSGAEDKQTKKQVLLQHQVREQWATPNNFCFQSPENTEQWSKRAEYQQTEKGVNLHKPIQSQVLHENKKVMGAMPPSATKLNSQWVTQLMGLNLGWVSPSCPASVIKNWPRFVTGWLQATTAPTNCDSSATESCLPPQNGLF